MGAGPTEEKCMPSNRQLKQYSAVVYLVLVLLTKGKLIVLECELPSSPHVASIPIEVPSAYALFALGTFF